MLASRMKTICVLASMVSVSGRDAPSAPAGICRKSPRCWWKSSPASRTVPALRVMIRSPGPSSSTGLIPSAVRTRVPATRPGRGAMSSACCGRSSGLRTAGPARRASNPDGTCADRVMRFPAWGMDPVIAASALFFCSRIGKHGVNVACLFSCPRRATTRPGHEAVPTRADPVIYARRG